MLGFGFAIVEPSDKSWKPFRGRGRGRGGARAREEAMKEKGGMT